MQHVIRRGGEVAEKGASYRNGVVHLRNSFLYADSSAEKRIVAAQAANGLYLRKMTMLPNQNSKKSKKQKHT